MNKTEESAKEENIRFKILILGDSLVGKTSCILRFCDDQFREDTILTVASDIKTKFIKRNDKNIYLEIWDSAGEERFKALEKLLYKAKDGIILIYAINKKSSFTGIKERLDSIRKFTDIKKLEILVIGNKIDLPKEEREVDEEMINAFKEKEKLEIIECSAKENINVNEAFISLIDKMIELELGKRRTLFSEDDDEENEKYKRFRLDNSNNRNMYRMGCFGGKKLI